MRDVPAACGQRSGSRKERADRLRRAGAEKRKPMSRPLLADPKRASEAARFHREVFAMFGSACFFCGKKATDAAHVLSRGTKLGPLRYCDPRIARPACRRCHDEQGAGRLKWPLSVRKDAVRAHNRHAKVPLTVPSA